MTGAVKPPTFGFAVSAQPAGVFPSRAYGDELPNKGRRLPLIVIAPACNFAIFAQRAGVIIARVYACKCFVNGKVGVAPA